MPGLDPGIHCLCKMMDRRVKPGNDDVVFPASKIIRQRVFDVKLRSAGEISTPNRSHQMMMLGN